jgi:acyl-CoA synthetase (AMP-forming)/AMP-acid ligase II
MVTTKKDALELEKQIQALKDNPGKRGPNDLEQRIENLMEINRSHQKLNGDLRAEVMFYKKKAEHYEIMSKQLKEDNRKLAQQINDQIERIRKGI